LSSVNVNSEKITASVTGEGVVTATISSSPVTASSSAGLGPRGEPGPKGDAGDRGPPGDTGPGFYWLGNYVAGNGYVPGAIVRGSDGNLYLATGSGGLGDPAGGAAGWSVYLTRGDPGAKGDPGDTPFTYRGNWDNFTAYGLHDAVTFDGGLWWLPATAGWTIGGPPPNYNWQLLVAGGAKGDPGDPATATTDAGSLTSGTLSDDRLSGNVVLTDDARLSDSRQPISHASSHGVDGSDPISIAASQVSGLFSGSYADLSGLPTLGSAASQDSTAFASATHASSHGVDGADPISIAASQLSGGEMPTNALLTASNSSGASATFQATGFAASSPVSVVVSGITDANDGFIAPVSGWGDAGGTQWSDLNGTYVRTSTAITPPAYTDGHQGMHTPVAGTYNYYIENPSSLGSTTSGLNGIAYFLAPGNRSGWGDPNNDGQTDTPVNYWRLCVLCDWPFVYFTNPSSDPTTFPTTGWMPVSASAPTPNEGAGYNGSDYLANYGGGFAVAASGGSSHLSSTSLALSGVGGSTTLTPSGLTLPNATQVIVGSFDNSTGGANGISLVCAVGYELNWQGGRLRSVQIGGNGTPQPIYVDSQLVIAPSASNSSVRVGSIELQSYSTNNCWIGDNVYLDGSQFVRRAAGAAGQFYFQGSEGQFRFGDSGDAGSVVSYQPVAKFGVGGIFAVGPSLGFNNGSLSGAILYCTGSSVGIADSTDLTKKLEFDVSLVAASTTRTLSVPDASGTIALTGHTHALSDLSQSGAASGQVVQWDGSAWVASTVSTGSTAWNDITGKPTFFSGAYADLTGLPTLGTASASDSSSFASATHTHALSSLTQSGASTGQAITWSGSAWVASTPFSGSYTDLTSKPTLGTAASASSTDFAAASHAHGNITNAGAIGSTSGQIVVTTTAGVLTTAATIASSAVTGLPTAGTGSTNYCAGNDARLSDSREWSASTVTQADAEAGTATARVAWTVQRVWQAIAAWWAASAAKTKLDGIATGATANSSDATLLARANHTGTQAASTITGLGTLATQSGTFSGTSSGTNTGDQTFSLTGDVTGSGTGSFAATLASTGVSAASYGSASSVATFTTDAKGRLTAAGSTSIAIAASAVTSGTFDVARLPVGTGSTQVAAGNDSRFSDSRSPTAHTHGNLTNSGAIGSTSGQIVVTTTGGSLTTAATISTSQVSGLGTAATSASSDFAAAVHTHSLSSLTQSSATTGQVPQWSGTAWVAATPSAASVADGSITTAKLASDVAIDCGSYSPVAPNAPTGLTATAGVVGAANLSWTAPTLPGGASITDYSIQYSTNSGSSWTSWSHSASTATSATITGLSGTATIFRVAGINSVGTGAYSLSSSSVTPISFVSTAVLLTSGTSYTVPSGATSMKAWAVGPGGSVRWSAAGGCAYKTWSVSGSTVTYSCGVSQSSPTNTSVTYGGTTIYGNAPASSGNTAGTYSGGDGGATGGRSDGDAGGNVGGNGAIVTSASKASCGRTKLVDVSGLKAALTLAGAKVDEDCGATAAFGSGAGGKYDPRIPAGYGGGTGEKAAQKGGDGAVVLYFT
jgi:hypothetical protein